jgi:hypothetical protein
MAARLGVPVARLRSRITVVVRMKLWAVACEKRGDEAQRLVHEARARELMDGVGLTDEDMAPWVEEYIEPHRTRA